MGETCLNLSILFFLSSIPYFFLSLISSFSLIRNCLRNLLSFFPLTRILFPSLPLSFVLFDSPLFAPAPPLPPTPPPSTAKTYFLSCSERCVSFSSASLPFLFCFIFSFVLFSLFLPSFLSLVYFKEWGDWFLCVIDNCGLNITIKNKVWVKILKDYNLKNNGLNGKILMTGHLYKKKGLNGEISMIHLFHDDTSFDEKMTVRWHEIRFDII